ncbi:hypothetical protein ACFL3M_03280 [Patescibacteria group bacterium]
MKKLLCALATFCVLVGCSGAVLAEESCEEELRDCVVRGVELAISADKYTTALKEENAKLKETLKKSLVYNLILVSKVKELEEAGSGECLDLKEDEQKM